MAVASTSRATFDEQGRNRDDPHVLHVHEGVGDHVAALVEVEERFGLCGLRIAATTTSSKIWAARSTISKCPL